MLKYVVKLLNAKGNGGQYYSRYLTIAKINCFIVIGRAVQLY